MRRMLAKQTFRSETIPETAFTGLLVDRLVRLAAARWTDHYGELGITKPALVVLVTIAAEGPLRQARLAQRSGVDRATLVALLNELERRDLARRAPDPTDRRAHAVSITAQGLALLQRAAELAERDEFFAVLTPAERETLDGFLLRVLAHVEPDARHAE